MAFKNHHSKEDLRRLMQKAQDEYPSSLTRCDFFYRDKSPSYFQEIKNNHGNKMKVYIKDNHGDPLSPINNNINGLFFGVNVGLFSSAPFTPAIYGEQRLKVPFEYFLRRNPNLYFTDFYCVSSGRAHYVTLVMTSPGSETDAFCSDKLIRLNWDSNPFLVVKEGQMNVTNLAGRMWTEVLYTDDVDVDDVLAHGGSLDLVSSRCVTRHGGRPKSYFCKICNIQKEYF